MTTLWYTRCPAPTAASIAIREGWLEEEFAPDGIAVRSISEASDESTRLATIAMTTRHCFASAATCRHCKLSHAVSTCG